MKTIRTGDQVVSMAPDGETVEVYSVVKVVGDAAQVDGTSGKLSKAALRLYPESSRKAVSVVVRSCYCV
jgi:hypothetical protein